MNLTGYVSQFYYTEEEINRVVTGIELNYDPKRVQYAIDTDYDLYELDRWEHACALNDKRQLQGKLAQIGFHFTQDELDQILADGERFADEISGPLWEKDYEIAEL